MSQQLYELVTFDQLDTLTKGETMTRLARGHKDAVEATRQLAEFQAMKAAMFVGKVEAAANENLCGLQAVAEIPLSIQAIWRAKFLTEDSAANVKGTTGYECWRDTGKNGFMTRFKKKNPQLFYKERKITNKVVAPDRSRIVSAGKYTKIDGRDA